MGIVHDAVRSSRSDRGFGEFSLDGLNAVERQYLKGITVGQIERWRGNSLDRKSKQHRGRRKSSMGDYRSRDRLVPWQVLVIFWLWGIKFGKIPPAEDMPLATFTELLWKLANNGEDDSTREVALHLYIDTVQSELMPDRRRGRNPSGR
jgi:hypothetical protein